jgi:type IV secretion system protein VirD4
MTDSADRSADDGLLIGAVLAAGGTSLVVWAGAQLAALASTRRAAPITPGLALRALVRLPSHASDPADAWPGLPPGTLPGPVLYWACTVVAAATAVALGLLGWRLISEPKVGSRRRTRLGVDTRSRLARRGDLAPLVVPSAMPGRLILGKVAGELVATEDRQRTKLARARVRRRQGDRSSVAIIGPTRCGKTANLISGILEWEGPAILSSVKGDLLKATLDARRAQGEVRVFDPTRAVRFDDRLRVGWSPLRAAGSVTGAKKAARALSGAAPRSGAENMNFFGDMAESLVWPLLWTAAHSSHSMRDVLRWILMQDRPGLGKPGEVAPIVESKLLALDPLVAEDAALAKAALTATWSLDDRTRGSTYATAATMVRAWEERDVAESALLPSLDLNWLLDDKHGANTLYVCGALHEQERLQTVFGGILGDLFQQVYERANRTGRLPRPLLVAMDEAGNTPVRWLPGVASTCAGLGVLLATVWQSKAQIDAAYDKLADSVLTNHGTKIIFSGVSDRATLDYVAGLLGEEEINIRALTADLARGVRSTQETTRMVDLVPADTLRQVAPGDALLIHQTLRPAHLEARPWYDDRHLRRLGPVDWFDDEGQDPAGPVRATVDLADLLPGPSQLALPVSVASKPIS